LAAPATPVAISPTEVAGHGAFCLSAGPTTFTVVPALGLLGTSFTHHDREYLALPHAPTAVLEGHTTGLPLLAPWANRIGGDTYRVGRQTVDLTTAPALHHDPNGLPIHGTMVGRDGWRIDRAEAVNGYARVGAVFDAAADDEVMASFPFPHELRVGMRVRPGDLDVTTTVVATGRRSVPVSFGWHPYFRLPGEEPDATHVHLPTGDRIVLDDRTLPSGEERVFSCTRPLAAPGYDHAYRLRANHRILTVSGRRRQITMTMNPGYHYGQVYSPPGETFVALEPMTAAIDALGSGTTPMVRPGQSYTARYRVTLS
jgi:aldose 1-epimerase